MKQSFNNYTILIFLVSIVFFMVTSCDVEKQRRKEYLKRQKKEQANNPTTDIKDKPYSYRSDSNGVGTNITMPSTVIEIMENDETHTPIEDVYVNVYLASNLKDIYSIFIYNTQEFPNKYKSDRELPNRNEYKVSIKKRGYQSQIITVAVGGEFPQQIVMKPE